MTPTCPTCASPDRGTRRRLHTELSQGDCTDGWHSAIEVDRRAAEYLDRARRDHRIAVVETIGCALAALRRVDSAWYDDDVRDMITKARSTLSVAQSTLKERIS
jgi:hypothetical protein